MINMQNLFPTHKELNIKDFEELWNKGLFVFDANVLLDLYRLPEKARKDLLNLFEHEKIKGRIWIPFQVSLEFTYNRLDVISDQKNKFTTVRKILEQTIVNIENLFVELDQKIKDLQLKKRHSVINAHPYINENLFRQPVD